MLHQVINRLDGVKTGDLMLLPLLMPVIVRFGLFFFLFFIVFVVSCMGCGCLLSG